MGITAGWTHLSVFIPFQYLSYKKTPREKHYKNFLSVH